VRKPMALLVSGALLCTGCRAAPPHCTQMDTVTDTVTVTANSNCDCYTLFARSSHPRLVNVKLWT